MQSAAFETCQQNQTSSKAFQQNQTGAETIQHHQRHIGQHGQGAFQHQFVQSAAAVAHWENQQSIKNMGQDWTSFVAQVKILGMALSHQKGEDEQLETRNLFKRLSLLLVMGNISAVDEIM